MYCLGKVSYFLQAGVATTITQPLDVLKTRMMNAKPGEFKGILDCVLYTAQKGPFAFFKVLYISYFNLFIYFCLLFMWITAILFFLGLRTGVCSFSAANYFYFHIFRTTSTKFRLFRRRKEEIKFIVFFSFTIFLSNFCDKNYGWRDYFLHYFIYYYYFVWIYTL